MMLSCASSLIPRSAETGINSGSNRSGIPTWLRKAAMLGLELGLRQSFAAERELFQSTHG